MKRATLLFGCYRRGDANDPDIYVAAIAAVLAMYDDEIIMSVTDPRSGITTTDKFGAFPPNSGEMKAYCDGVASRQDRIGHYASLPRPAGRVALPAPPPKDGRRANLFIPRQNTQLFEKMCRLAEHADRADFEIMPEGIRVPLTWHQPR